MNTEQQRTKLLGRLNKREVVIVDVVAMIINGALSRLLCAVTKLAVFVMEPPRITDRGVRGRIVMVHGQEMLALIRALFELGRVRGEQGSALRASQAVPARRIIIEMVRFLDLQRPRTDGGQVQSQWAFFASTVRGVHAVILRVTGRHKQCREKGSFHDGVK